MAEVIHGQAAVVWGAQGITMTAGIVSGTNAQQVNSFDIERNGDVYEIKNSGGEVIGEVYYNNGKVLRLTVLPTAGTVANAQASWSAHLIAPGTKINVVDTGSTILDGDYNLRTAKGRGDQTNPRMIDLEMVNKDANDITPTIS